MWCKKQNIRVKNFWSWTTLLETAWTIEWFATNSNRVSMSIEKKFIAVGPSAKIL